jgi:hypothetical protein
MGHAAAMPSFRYEEDGGFHMLAPHRAGRTYHNFRGNKINDYKMKSCIFFEDNGLWKKQMLSTRAYT